MKILISLILSSIIALADNNRIILEAVHAMPKGGGYATNLDAAIGLRKSSDARGGNFYLRPEFASPSYCSGATYLVLLKALQTLQSDKTIFLNNDALKTLLVKGESDGYGIWGRWNANGPGTAKLLSDLEAGRNFEDVTQARAGDFMKIFWSKGIGKKERGHLVVFLKKEKNKLGEWEIHYWSSNKPHGFSSKVTKAHSIKWCIFSRIESPRQFEKVSTLPLQDTFLSDMLKKDFTKDMVRKECNIIGERFNELNLQEYLEKKYK